MDDGGTGSPLLGALLAPSPSAACSARAAAFLRERKRRGPSAGRAAVWLPRGAMTSAEWNVCLDLLQADTSVKRKARRSSRRLA